MKFKKLFIFISMLFFVSHLGAMEFYSPSKIKDNANFLSNYFKSNGGDRGAMLRLGKFLLKNELYYQAKIFFINTLTENSKWFYINYNLQEEYFIIVCDNFAPNPDSLDLEVLRCLDYIKLQEDLINVLRCLNCIKLQQDDDIKLQKDKELYVQDIVKKYKNIVNICFKEKNYSKAEATLLKMLDFISSENYPQNRCQSIKISYNLGVCCYKQKKLAEAIKYFEVTAEKEYIFSQLHLLYFFINNSYEVSYYKSFDQASSKYKKIIKHIQAVNLYKEKNPSWWDVIEKTFAD